MLKRRLAQYFVAAAVSILATATFATSCNEINFGGSCETAADCYTWTNFPGWGVLCVDGRCGCPPSETGEESMLCCPNGVRGVCPPGPTALVDGFEFDLGYRCRAVSECARLALEAVGEQPSKCELDEECPGPPDSRCGKGRCNEGRCELEIDAHKPLSSQFPGDCKLTVCSPSGSPEDVFDPTDVRMDGNLCTLDTCTEQGPENPPWPTRTPCSTVDPMICFDGRCQECAEAFGDAPCPPGFECDKNKCVPMTCMDVIQNGTETGVNCGGPDCVPCAPGWDCNVGSDCDSGICFGGVCQAPTTNDGVKNGEEMGVDCGYPGGPENACKDGEACESHDTCKSFVCYDGVCQTPTCTDAVQNGSETGVDCGGACSSPCSA